MPARDDLDQAIRDIRQFAETAKIVVEDLAEEHQDANETAARIRQRLDSALGDQVQALQAKLDAERRNAEQLQAQIASWERNIRRRSAITLVTAFEVFLRQFLIEKIAANQAHLHSFIARRLGIDVSALPSPVPVEQIEDCVDRTCETFSDFTGKVNTYYAEWLGHGYLKPGQTRTTFATPLHQQQTQWDIEILLQLRHVLVHKAGTPNQKYHDILTDDQRRSRLDPAVMTVGPSPVVAPPDEILASPGSDGLNPTKLDDFYVAVLAFTDHINAIY